MTSGISILNSEKPSTAISSYMRIPPSLLVASLPVPPSPMSPNAMIRAPQSTMSDRATRATMEISARTASALMAPARCAGEVLSQILLAAL
ncbi:unnamed protein product [Boreogadus saida]